MINPNLSAVVYNKDTFKDFTIINSPLSTYKIDDYAFIYFGRRYLTENEHLVLVPFGVDANIPPYMGGVGYLLVKDSTSIRSLTCKQCKTPTMSLESFYIHEDNSDYLCSHCNVERIPWEDIKK